MRGYVCYNRLVPSVSKKSQAQTWIAAAVLIILLLAAGAAYGGYRYYLLSTDFKAAQEKIASLSNQLTDRELENQQLIEALQAEQARTDALAEEIEDITDTVSDLTKLSQIDEELLTKYSKVFFLSENYRPDDLVEIPRRYRSPENDDEFIHADVYEFLKDMIEDAEDDGVELKVVSGFRSFEEQSSLKGQYTVTYGSGANAFSADQGYSEHQLGTTVDFTTEGLGGGIEGFQNTEAYTWLLNNAHKYGFVLSYPSGNSYYVFEPWHWRFVGRDLARDLERRNQDFYDLDQRTLDTYLIKLFD